MFIYKGTTLIGTSTVVCTANLISRCFYVLCDTKPRITFIWEENCLESCLYFFPNHECIPKIVSSGDN